jgi:hypothetical protein
VCEKLARSLVGARYASMTKQRALNALFAGAYAGRVRRAPDSDVANTLSRIAKEVDARRFRARGQIATVL